MKLLKSLLFALVGVLLIITLSCFFPNPNLIISSSEDKKIEWPDDDGTIVIYEEETDSDVRTIDSRKPKTPATLDNDEILTFKARILPVVVEGEPVHANDVIIL